MSFHGLIIHFFILLNNLPCGASQVAQLGKELLCNSCYARALGDAGSFSGSGRSTGVRNGNLLHFSCLGTPMDGGAWWAVVHGARKSQI